MSSEPLSELARQREVFALEDRRSTPFGEKRRRITVVSGSQGLEREDGGARPI
jgi:hypothetical protein